MTLPPADSNAVSAADLNETILDDVAEVRLARVRGVELEYVGASRLHALVPYTHPLVRLHARPRDQRPCADGRQNPLAGAG